MATTPVGLMETIYLPIFIEEQPQERITNVVFSPKKPDTLCVLYEDHPPFFHDLRKAGLPAAIQMALAGEQPEPLIVTDHTAFLKTRFRSSAVSVAYRGDAEAAVAHGEGDGFVYRVLPRRGEQLEPICFDNPSRVVYSRDGELMAIGSTDGRVALYRIDGPEAELIREVKLDSAVVALVIDEAAKEVLAATDFHGLSSFSINGTDDSPIRNGVNVENDSVTAMKTLCLATSDDGFVGWAGIGNQVWVSNPYLRRGQVSAYGGVNRVRSMQFVDGSDKLVLFAEDVVKLARYSVDEQHQPVMDSNTVTFHSLGEGFRMVGAHHYGSLLCIAHATPAD